MAPKQRTIFEFARCARWDEPDQATRDAARAAKLERRDRALRTLDLPWPEPIRRLPGRPIFQEAYERVDLTSVDHLSGLYAKLS